MKLLVYLCFFALLLLGGITFAQTADEKAQSAYLIATDAYEKGNYTDAVNYLKQARDLLGKTNTKIQYLLVKTLMDAKEYPTAEAELKTYFEVTPETARDARYEEMVRSVAFVERIAKEAKELEAIRIKKRAEDSTAMEQQVRLKSVKISQLYSELVYNEKRANRRLTSKIILSLASSALGAYGGSEYSRIQDGKGEGPKGLLVAASLALTFGVLEFTSLIVPNRFRSKARELRTELRELQKADNKKPITLSPFFIPRQQTAGFAVRMRF